jgi:hypothetical protein
VTTRFKDKIVYILDFYPILSGIINIVILFSLLCYILLKGWKYDDVFNKTILLGASFWLLNAAFTIIASSVALRFQSFPIILTTIFVAFLLNWMAQLMGKLKNEIQDKRQMQISEGLSKEVIA